MDYRASGSSVHRILQARILDWVARPSPFTFLHISPPQKIIVPPSGDPQYNETYLRNLKFPPVTQMVKNLPVVQETWVSLGGFPRGGHGDPLQYFCLEDSMNRGAWRAIVYRVAKGWTQLSDSHNQGSEQDKRRLWHHPL